MKKPKKEETGKSVLKIYIGFTLNSEVIFLIIIYYFTIIGIFRSFFTSYYLNLFYIENNSTDSTRLLGGLMLSVSWLSWSFKSTSDSTIFKKFMRTYFIFFCFELFVAFFSSNLTYLGILVLQTSSFLLLLITFWVGFIIAV